MATIQVRLVAPHGVRPRSVVSILAIEHRLGSHAPMALAVVGSRDMIFHKVATSVEQSRVELNTHKILDEDRHVAEGRSSGVVCRCASQRRKDPFLEGPSYPSDGGRCKRDRRTST